MSKPDSMTQFGTGATRSDSAGKPDYRGYLSPKAIKLFGEYMLKHQTQADGRKRRSDNWKKGMPLDRYVESLFRHSVAFHDAWDNLLAELDKEEGQNVEAIMAQLLEDWGGLFFNVQGIGHELGVARERGTTLWFERD